MVIFLVGLVLTSGCARQMTAAESYHQPPDHMQADIVGRSVKGVRSDRTTYRFREEVEYALAGHLNGRRLSVAKTICVETDCKTARSRSISSKRSDRIKISFQVNEREMDKQFTMITRLIGDGVAVKTYWYRFFPRDCVEDECRE